MSLDKEIFREKWIAVQEGSHLQEHLMDIFFGSYSMNPYPLGGISPHTLELIAQKQIELLAIHPITSEQKLIVEAHKQIPVVVIRGSGDVEGPGDDKMFHSFLELGIPIINKVSYFKHGYLIQKFALDLLLELSRQMR